MLYLELAVFRKHKQIKIGVHIPDGVVGLETEPLGKRTVLLLGLGELDLSPERLVGLELVVVQTVVPKAGV